MLQGKTCLVTGATSGIGRATAEILAAEGARVVGVGRNAEALQTLKEVLGDALAAGIQADLCAPGEPERVVREAVAALGSLTTLVNVAGVLQGGAVGSEACDLGNYQANMTGNFQQVFECVQHATPHLVAAAEASPSKTGSAIVSVSSVNGQQSFAGCAAYCASKAALDMFSRCAALDLAPKGVRVNTVNPGVVETPLQKRGGMTDDAYARFLDRSVNVTHPLAVARGSVASSEEVGHLIAFLVSDKAGFITGDNIRIDGGRGCLGAR